MIEFLISAGILLFLAGSIIAIRPSSLQRKQGQFRSLAIAEGFHLSMVKSEHPIAQGRANLVGYSKWLDANANASDELWQNIDSAIVRCRDQFPGSISGVERIDNQLIVYWDESGTLNDLKSILTTMQLILSQS